MIAIRHLTRRRALLMPIILAACGGEDEPVYQPLHFDYLPPIQLNVSTIDTQQLFVPSGVPPDVTVQDPEPPVDALKAMANDRLKAFGTAGRSVFAINDASLTKRDDVIHAVMSVSLTIYGPDESKAGFAEARVEHTQTGYQGSLHKTLYDLTKAMMDNMNVEFEYQIRQHLQDWLASGEAPATPVEQTPLGSGGPGQTPSIATSPAAVPLSPPPSNLAPSNLAPPSQLVPDQPPTK